MYTVGSLADLISGSNTPNKPKVEVKEVKVAPFKAKTPKKDTEKREYTPKKNFSETKSPKKNFGEGKGEGKSPKQQNSPQKRKGELQSNEGGKKKKFEPKTEPEKKPVSINAKNAVKRMRDKKKERHINPEQDERTIFVGNVPLSAKKNDVIKFFTQYGKVKSMRFRGAARANLKLPKKAAFITKQFHPKVTTANCYVVFAEKESTIKALEANGKVFMNNHIRVDLITRDHKVQEQSQKKAIFVGNVPFDAKDEDLWKTFENCGKIESVRLVRDGLTGVGKGYGYVNFESSDAVELAMQMTEVKLKNREIRIKRSVVNSKEKENKKRNEKGEKIRKVPRKPKEPKTKEENVEKTEEMETTEEKTEETVSESPKAKKEKDDYQGVKFTDKKKKKKANKTLLQKKKMSKLLAPKKKTAA